MTEQPNSQTALTLLEQRTLAIVRDFGRDPSCRDDCNMAVGRKCPLNWCERVYQRTRKDMEVAK